MQTLKTRKNKIISQIHSLNNEPAIHELEEFLKKLNLQLYHSNIIKPIKSKMLVEDMVLEQNYCGVDRTELDKIIREMDIQEPIKELIALV